MSQLPHSTLWSISFKSTSLEIPTCDSSHYNLVKLGLGWFINMVLVKALGIQELAVILQLHLAQNLVIFGL